MPAPPVQSYPMLLSISRSTEKFTPLLGLRSLFVPDTASGGGGGFVTRTVVPSASRGACRGEIVQKSGDGDCIDEEDDDEGCWVSYGRRGPRRWLAPPPIPSLASWSTLRRTRTEDGRLVITKVPAMRHEYYIRARRRGGRLIMQLVKRQDFDPLPAPDPSPAPSAREDGIALQVVDDATTAIGEGLHDEVHTVAAMPPAVPPPQPSVGCFEDVVKYHSIGSSSLHLMHMLKMVH